MAVFPAETVSFHVPEGEKKMVSLPDLILARGDIALVGTGSLSCMRSLYLSARNSGKSHQFFPCMIPAEAYATGENGKYLKDTLNAVLQIPNVGGIIIYASCMDVLNQTDFDAVIASLDNPQNIPIRPLFRGPMVKRYLKPAKLLREILDTMPDTGKQIPKGYEALPPLGPDFNCISSALQGMDVYPFLLTAGGCGGGVENLGMSGVPYRMKHSRFADVQVSLGCTQAALECISQDYNATYADSNRPLIAIMGSAVPAFTGVDCDGIAAALEESGIPAISLACDGFTPGPVGLSKALLTLGKALICQPDAKDPRLVGILGHSTALLGRQSKLDHGQEHLNKRNFRGVFWGEEGIENTARVSLNWVVSAAGLPLARYMEKQFGIPYITGIPVGAAAMLRWRKQVNVLLQQDDEVLVPMAGGMMKAGNPDAGILLIGEPLLMNSIQSSMKEDMGYRNITLAVYAPLPSLRKFYREVCKELPLQFFSNAAELRALAEGAEFTVADPVYETFLPHTTLIPLPDPQISGDQYLDIPYEIFGKKGAAYLFEKINNKKENHNEHM